MEIKRVLAGGLAALAAGSTLALGVGAATCPVKSTGLGQFVCISGNTMTSPYIVIGDKAVATDTLAAADIGVALGGVATEEVSVAGATGTLSVTNGAFVETKSTKLYANDAFNAVLSKFTVKELPTLLATGEVTQKNAKDIEYTQRITPGVQKVLFNRDSDWADPVLNVELAKDVSLYNYTIKFSPSIATGDEIANKEIELFGEPYVFTDVEADLTNLTVTLFAASETKSITAGSSEVVNVLGTDYTITVIGINEAGDEATIDVNGEAFEVSDPDDLDIEKGDLKAHVKAIRAHAFPVAAGSVELFIGSEEMVLENGSEVELGGENVDNTLVTIVPSSDKIRSITIEYSMEDKELLRTGESFADPVFETFKVAFGGIYPALTDESKDMFKLEMVSATDIELTFTNLDGNTYEFTLFEYDKTNDRMIVADGSENNFEICNGATLTEDDYVIVSDDEYSYVLVFEDFDKEDEEVILEDIETGTQYPISLDDVGSTVGIGSIDVEVLAFSVGNESVNLNFTASALNTTVPIYTASGGHLDFNIVNTTNCSVYGVWTAGGVLTNVNNYLDFTESDFETTTDATEATVRIDLTTGTDEFTAIDVDGANSTIVGTNLVADEDGDYEYGITESGTYFVRDVTDDEEIMTVYAVDEPHAVYVAFGSNPTFSSGEGVSAGTVEQAVPIKNSISKMEAQITTSTLSRDLVLIGGPCANALVAEALNMSAASGQCTTDFMAMYPTEGVITIVEDVFDSGQKALVVAGVDRVATRALAEKVMQGTLAYSA